MGANKTEKAITLQTKAVTGIREIVETFDNSSEVSKSSSKYSRSGSKVDETNMIIDLQKIQPFTVIPGQNHPSFPHIKANPRDDLNMADFNQWIKKHLNQLNKIGH